jgi:DNA-binding MarR family transcriptional regulator
LAQRERCRFGEGLGFRIQYLDVRSVFEAVFRTLGRRVNPDTFQQLDKVIHEKSRMAIMSMLAGSPELSFTELRNSLKMTDGNLTTHIRTLQKSGYVSVSKSFRENRPLTTCSLTVSGIRAFNDYVTLLERIVKQAQRSK